MRLAREVALGVTSTWQTGTTMCDEIVPDEIVLVIVPIEEIASDALFDVVLLVPREGISHDELFDVVLPAITLGRLFGVALLAMIALAIARCEPVNLLPAR